MSECWKCKDPLPEDSLSVTCDWECEAARQTGILKMRFFDRQGDGYGLARTPKGYLVAKHLIPAAEA